MSRDLFARAALADIPKILTLQDRNRHSPTYGCFDRNFWQYKVIDFPSGMAQEFVYPLALAYSLDCPGNSYRADPAVRDWIEAGLRFMARSAHADGSCDDYYPFERAAGAAAFSLLAGIESYNLLGLDDADLGAFFAKRGRWLTDHRESGRLSNHEALIALNALRLAQMTGDAHWSNAFEDRLNRLLSWQDEEGWFQEYEGCDPGYLTLTISLLAQIQASRPDAGVEEALGRAIDVAAAFVHPDGSYGGEYGSRNTYNFFPHGFELAGRDRPAALAVNDRFLRGLADQRQACHADDHIVGHHTWNYLLAWRDYATERPAAVEWNGTERRYFPNAGLLVDRRASNTLIVALNKGGVFKLFRDDIHLCSDTQISIRGADGRIAVAHMIGDHERRVDDDAVTVEGDFAWAKQAAMTPAKLVVLRLVMLSAGRWFPDLIRRLLQRMLITGRSRAPYRFRRVLRWTGEVLQVRDEVRATDWRAVESVGIEGHQTSIHVVMSRTYQAGQHQPWLDLTDRARALAAGEPLVVERSL